MPSRNITVVYGEMNQRQCGLCGKLKTRFGSLIDPNGHTWIICADDIDALWHRNAAIIVDSEIEERAKQLIQERLLGMGDD
jgi:hypothetical protein